ncbi:hypothetical protein ANO11243_038040 [Dothideomycetidae sp. 11243]|nr:hypothetical protein ANO11243_038040 [fungal sp. No.11243]
MGDAPDIPFQDGRIPFKIPSVHKECFTYYKVAGDLSCGKTPLVCLHGGPGGSHEMTLDFAFLWPRHGIPVIFYDQIGGGQSTNLDDEKSGDHGFWQVSLFVDELDNLLDHLNLREGPGFDLLGVSWGAMLASEFATSRPNGLRRLLLGSPIADYELMRKVSYLRRAELPLEAQKALNEAEETQDWSTEAFRKAFIAYFQHCTCRIDPLPPGFEFLIFNSWNMNTVLTTMSDRAGPCRLRSRPGSLRDFNVTPRLHSINVPTLVWNGEFDQSHDLVVQPFFERIPRVRWHTFAGASHVITFEGDKLREACFKLIADFVNQQEGMCSLDGTAA